MHIVIRTEAHPDIGLGHLMRMLALAEWLRLHGLESLFVLTRFADCRFTAHFAADIEKRIADGSFHLYWQHFENDITDADTLLVQFATVPWFVVDAYSIGAAWISRLMANRRRVCVMDDHPELHRAADLVVDPTPFSMRDAMADENVCFAGAAYFLASIDLASRHFSADTARVESDTRRWFVSFGGTDVQRMLPHTLKTLAEFVTPDALVYVAIHPAAPHLHEIRSIQTAFPCRVELIHEPRQIVAALADSGFAIGAAGGMTMERALLGIPSLATMVADNQADIYRRLSEQQLSYTLPPEAFIGGNLLRERLATILAERAQWPQFRTRCLRLSQGLGAGWLAQYLSREVHQDIYLRVARDDFRERLFAWQSIPGIRRYSRDPTAPTWPEHCAWYKNYQSAHNSVMAEIIYQQESVGMLRLDYRGAAPLQFEISLLLDPACHGRGVGRAALRMARSLVPFGIFLACIQPENHASLRAFAAAGYRPDTRPDYFRQEPLYADTN